MRIPRKHWITFSGMFALVLLLLASYPADGGVFTVPDTGQSLCFDTLGVIQPPDLGEPFYGQDAQYSTAEPSYVDNGDGTVTDLNTGLMWQQDLPPAKMTWGQAMAGADTCTVGGYSDWRLPDIKELYSLIHFSGTDPSGPVVLDPVPFIDTDFFQFQYGDTLSGERLIDAQYWSSTCYQGLTMNGDSTAFGVNFADGRIKGYPREEVGPSGRDFLMTSYVRYVRGEAFGENQFVENGDGTVTDTATGLMWQQSDDGMGRNWEEALAYAEDLSLAGYGDWRLPDAHELQGIVDYQRSMQATGSAAMDPVFGCTQITDEGGGVNYGFYWTGTTHQSTLPGEDGTFAVYVAFGEALGWMTTPDSTPVLMDVHGAGAQRSDPKCGDPDDWPWGNGPQGDVVRIYNLVRCVRMIDTGIVGSETAAVPTLAAGSANPFTGTVTIWYSIPTQGQAAIHIFDASGRMVDSIQWQAAAAGEGSVQWTPDGGGLSTGPYFACLTSAAGTAVTRLILIR